jgi:hypothetical protein
MAPAELVAQEEDESALAPLESGLDLGSRDRARFALIRGTGPLGLFPDALR